VIEPAVPPTAPARSRPKYFAAGLVAALGLACLVGIALELLDPVLVSPLQLERESGMPVLGSVPRIS
jgi:capsular polysaccharide biosynthesis protein